jgi:Tfp pilus assembly protein FimT
LFNEIVTPNSTYMLESFPLYIGKHTSNNHHPFGSNLSCDLDRQWRTRTDRGLSLLEAMVVLFILTTTAAAVVPNLISWRAGMRLQSAINELLGDLQSAKNLAAKHNTTFTVQFEPAESSYQITYVNSDGQVVALKREAFPPEIRIDSSHPDYTLTNHRTAFTSRGGATPGTLVVSNLAKKSRKIVISSIGKVRTENLK